MALTDEDKQWIKQQLHELTKSFADELESVETKLLTEFHKWASPNEAKQRQFSTALRSFEIQLEAIDDRVKKLEGRT